MTSMLSFLKNHPFAVEAFFESSLVLSYAIPKDKLIHLIPECLELDTFQDQWGFVAVAIVQTKALRPKGFPQWVGNDFILIGYRIFVRYTGADGRRLRGLYILKSETNKKKMEFLGNIFTHYDYTTTDIQYTRGADCITIHSTQSGLDLSVSYIVSDEVALPAGSPFNSWVEARRFAGPLPFTFTYNAEEAKVLIIEGVRHNWRPQPVSVCHQQVAFLDQMGLGDIGLANAFIVERVPYYWRKGRIEKWAR